jgi:DNA-binding transcriptional regulator YdaS (Cro superfamily)
MARQKDRKDPALQHAIDAAGGAAELARALGVTIQAVCGWKKCPPRRAVAVERATKGIVSRERLCPEVFGAAKRERLAA